MTPLVLASTSRFRRELLARLGLPFIAVAPVCDETPLPGESAADTASRLASVKARSLIGAHPQALIIGSDQVALLDGQQLGKPGTPERAAAMLARADDDRVLRLHPEDIRLIGKRLPEGLEVVPDPALERGALRVETASGGVEDGPSHWRRAIAEALSQC